MAEHPFGSRRFDPELLTRNMRSAWDRIAHERVQERLKSIFRLISLSFGTSGGSSGDLYERYSEQAKRSRNSTSHIVSRELEDALHAIEDNAIQKAFDIYADESPEEVITSFDWLWATYNFGIIPFITNEVLRDVCFRLANAQPSLGLDLSRLDAERFFSYNSPELRKQFPVVIRIVDELNRDWYDKVLNRANEINSSAPVSSAARPSSPPAGIASETRPQTVQQRLPDLHPSQPAPQASTESSPSVASAIGLSKAEREQVHAHNS